MGVRKFAGEDHEFREWVAKRPRGYVLNTHRDYSDRENTRLHRAACFTLEPGFGGGAIQTGEQIKVCSPDPKELNEWAVGNLGYGLRSLRCQHLRAIVARADGLKASQRGRRRRVRRNREAPA